MSNKSVHVSMNGANHESLSGTLSGPDGVAMRAFDDLLPEVYDELRALAEGVLRNSRIVNSTQTSSLINDVYVRLSNKGVRVRDRAHFLCLSARAMRLVLIDRARRASAAKRGGCQAVVALDGDIAAAREGPDLLAVDEALLRLVQFDERKSRIVELRFFGGLSVEETAEVLGLSPATVKREWALARAWLSREIGEAYG